jgi:hypothetical protein
VERDISERRRAKRDYLIAGGLAIAAAIVGVADQGALPGVPIWLAAIAVALAAALFARAAFAFLGRGDEEAGPTVERMRRMAILWLALAALIGVAVFREPFAAFREAGAAGLRARQWAAAACGAAIVAAACVRAVALFRNRGRRPGGEAGGE